MKEKIKEHLVVVSFLYGIIIILLMGITYFKMDTHVEFQEDEDFVVTLNNYKKEIMLLDDTNCKSTLNKLVNYIEQNNLSGSVNLKDYYNKVFYNNESILNFYREIKNTCPMITEDVAKEHNLPIMFITASIQNDEIFGKYLYQYEINMKDLYFRNISEPALTSIENKIKNEMELKLIKDVLKIVKDLDIEEE